jgi:hypothetical protein
MENNFNLRKFLTENKLTQNSKLVREDEELYNLGRAAGVKYGKDIDNINNPAGELSSRVDQSSIEIDGVDTSDYPDFVDAFISAANFEDGTPLTDDELDQLTDEMRDEIHQMAYDSLMEGLSKREKTLKEQVLKALK